MKRPDYLCKFCSKKESEHQKYEYSIDGGIHGFRLSDFDKGFKTADEMWREQVQNLVRAI